MKHKGLELIDSLRMVAGAAAGKVLTSDAGGNATWQTPAAAGAGYAQFSTVSAASSVLFSVDSALDKGWDISLTGRLTGTAGADRGIYAVPRSAAGVAFGTWFENFSVLDTRDTNAAGGRAFLNYNGAGKGWLVGFAHASVDCTVAAKATIDGTTGGPRSGVADYSCGPLVNDNRLFRGIVASNSEDGTTAFNQLFFTFDGALFTGTIRVTPLGR